MKQIPKNDFVNDWGVSFTQNYFKLDCDFCIIKNSTDL